MTSLRCLIASGNVTQSLYEDLWFHCGSIFRIITKTKKCSAVNVIQCTEYSFLKLKDIMWHHGDVIWYHNDVNAFLYHSLPCNDCLRNWMWQEHVAYAVMHDAAMKVIRAPLGLPLGAPAKYFLFVGINCSFQYQPQTMSAVTCWSFNSLASVEASTWKKSVNFLDAPRKAS